VLIRLNKYISQSGLCSRREADSYISDGKVLINGQPAGIGTQVAPGDIVVVNGHTIEPRDEERLVFIALNKPRGIVSTTEETERSNIVDFVGHPIRIFPIGRLDKESQGLIFLTNNGDLVNKILRAGNNHEKEYLVTVNRPITDKFIESMSKGVPILGVVTKGCKVVQESTYVFRITLIQGLNRQIRRMAEYFDYEVTKLDRVRVMNVSLKGISVGDWRDLDPKELEGLFKLIEGSSSEAPKKEGKKVIKKKSNNPSKKKVSKTQMNKTHGFNKNSNKPDRRKKKSNRR
jgi:23S rRNA pseudouridine2604 synthase